MSTFLLCATPVYGHVAPMITICRHLVAAGHQVSMLTGSRFAESLAGMRHIALPAGADYDDRDIAGAFPETERLTGIRRLRFDVENNFIAVMPHQYRGVREQLDSTPFDAVLAETAFTGVIPLLQERGRTRPPVLICGVLPLTLSSRDTAPFGLGLQPSSSPVGRLRNRALNLLVSKGIFGRAQRQTQAHLCDLGVAALPCFVMDFNGLADQMLQLTSAGFEYPRTDLHTTVSFVGSVLPAAADHFEPPAWWSDLDTDRPVVLVTQGTIANNDVDRLITPTLRSLADRDVLVVVTTGNEDSAAAVSATAPANVRVAAFLPYDRLLPKVDVMVTNGGYGGVQSALSHGVPLVVAGDTEDKPEIAARVAWSGAGVNLRTGSPTAKAIGDAVTRLLTEPEFRASAEILRAELASCTPLDTITRALESAGGVRENASRVGRSSV